MELTQNVVQTISIKSTAETARNRFIGFDGDHCEDGAKALGVAEFDGVIGKYMPVHTYGIVIAEAGGVIPVGAAVKSDSNGKAVAAANIALAAGSTPVTANSAAPGFTGSITPEAINGYALDAASGDGDLIRIKLL